ncbi:hypothetical protein Bca52824_024510 [Brassica carinata]|uniref:Putative plant transposon protein domain-containing protein n=1 Tax=Brassica carinata TaxID=52824 RepID=A0A8X8AVV7_BRACI|nr:hypothetical protein Bca52824_024510 [Brassica carinata]
MSFSSSASTHRRHREYHSPSPNHRSSSSSDHGEEEPRFMTFESRLEASRGFFIAGTPVANPWSIRHVTEESFRKYQQLCIRGFLVQGMLVLDDPAFAEVRTIVDNVGWMYTVLHVWPFCPRVVRECISNLYIAEDGVYIRGCRFDFNPVVTNQLFMTPIVEHSHPWVDDDLSQSITFLTGGRCPRWEIFSLTQLLPQYIYLYKLCELNWLPGFHVDAMIKKRLRFLFAFVRNKPIDFGRLVYDQVVEMSRDSDADKKIVLPNFIYQTLNLQREILALPGDEPLIGEPLRINGVEADLSHQFGKRITIILCYNFRFRQQYFHEL